MKGKLYSIVKIVFNEFVYGGHLPSLGCALGFMGSIMIILDLPLAWQPILILYLISQIIYTYNHFKELKDDADTNPERVKYLEKRVRYFPLILFSYALLLLGTIIIFTNWQIFLYIAILVLGGILYTVYLKKLTSKIICFKNLYISFSWALAVFIPFLYYSLSFKYFFLFFFFFVFFRVILNTIFFDIKDIEEDKKKNLKTLPAITGKRKSLRVLHIINLISFIPIIIGILIEKVPFFVIILVLLYFYSFYYLLEAQKLSSERIRRFSYIMVDGEYYFWPLLLLIAKSIF